MSTLPVALLLLITSCSMVVEAFPLLRRQQPVDDGTVEPTSNDGQLDSQWIIVIAVVIAVVVLGVIATMVWVRLRRRRRYQDTVHIRPSSPYSVRQSRQEPPNEKPPLSPEPITTPLPALTYHRLRDSSTSSLGGNHR